MIHYSLGMAHTHWKTHRLKLSRPNLNSGDSSSQWSIWALPPEGVHEQLFLWWHLPKCKPQNLHEHFNRTERIMQASSRPYPRAWFSQLLHNFEQFPGSLIRNGVHKCNLSRAFQPHIWRKLYLYFAIGVRPIEWSWNYLPNRRNILRNCWEYAPQWENCVCQWNTNE